jgi:hypothetical protein
LKDKIGIRAQRGKFGIRVYGTLGGAEAAAGTLGGSDRASMALDHSFAVPAGSEGA